ncbi:hypothetical protein V6S67_19605 [Arthrobacter sp. Soc17.1.1.1]|uniref:hypothetical protein n=1 Tax=Arthrobacter sp. Soc17.1.1.1 TaxID=3121277 RepID=UPI002FE48671
MKIYLLISSALLAVAAILSLIPGRSDVRVGVALGLLAVIASDAFGWRSNQPKERKAWPDLTQTDDTGRTSYYYEDDEDILNAPSSGCATNDQ